MSSAAAMITTTLVQAHRRALIRGRTLRIRGASDHALRLFQVTGIDRELTIEADPGTASLRRARILEVSIGHALEGGRTGAPVRVSLPGACVAADQGAARHEGSPQPPGRRR